MSSFTIRKTLSEPFDAVLSRIPDALKREGFGVLTEIDVRETLKKKLDVDMGRYKILGACNPTFAHEALSAEPDIGVMMPCSVAVHEAANGETVVATIDPERAMGGVGNPVLQKLAIDLSQKLRRVISAL